MAIGLKSDKILKKNCAICELFMIPLRISNRGSEPVRARRKGKGYFSYEFI